MSARAAFLKRVRDAVVAGNQAGAAAPIPERGDIGYQGGGSDLVETFVAAARAMGMKASLVSDSTELAMRVAEVLTAKSAQSVLLGRGLDDFDWRSWLIERGIRVIAANDPKEELFSADVSLTSVANAIAETGSLIIASSPTMTRLESLIAPTHIAIVRRTQILADVFDAFAGYSADQPPPSNVVFITGPSKTGDIELKLVTGVHGPGEVHVFIMD